MSVRDSGGAALCCDFHQFVKGVTNAQRIIVDNGFDRTDCREHGSVQANIPSDDHLGASTVASDSSANTPDLIRVAQAAPGDGDDQGDDCDDQGDDNDDQGKRAPLLGAEEAMGADYTVGPLSVSGPE